MWHVSIVKVAEVTRTLSAVISELKSVPIGDTNILVTCGWRRGNNKCPNGGHKKARSETG
jgi:hypothetical protein